MVWTDGNEREKMRNFFMIKKNNKQLFREIRKDNGECLTVTACFSSHAFLYEYESHVNLVKFSAAFSCK